MTADETKIDRVISLLEIEIQCNIDDESIILNARYGKVFDETTIDTKDMKEWVTTLKEKIIKAIKEELE